MTSVPVYITYDSAELKNQAEQLAIRWNIDCIEPSAAETCAGLLTVTAQRLELSLPSQGRLNAIYADFLSDAALYRTRHGGGRHQLIARAVGLHKKKNLTLCDISAGLGRDAFVLAALGAQVTMIERSPIIAALLEDGWQRAQECEWIRALSWRYLHLDSRIYLQNLPPDKRPQIIYFDPMFPERKKTALAKKAMRVLREIVGEDLDSPDLLNLALKTALDRVVVKRPRLAPPIPGIPPSFTLEGQSSRFDVYLTHSVITQ